MSLKSRQARKNKRLVLIAVAGSVFALAVGLVLFALNDQIVFFRTPTEIVSGAVEPGTKVRVGGLVEEGSIVRNGQTVSFGVTDTGGTFTAIYDRILPDLFREGQGVVIEGMLRPDGQFEATNVLAKHDENYIPAEVAEALKEQGVWKGDGTPDVKAGANY